MDRTCFMGSSGVSWTPLGESALVVEFGERMGPEISASVWAFARELERNPIRGVVDYVAAYTTVTLMFDPLLVRLADVVQAIESLLVQLRESTSELRSAVEIPICYDAEYGPDLTFVAQHSGLTTDEVIELHVAGEYTVALIGFVPGFPYLSGMSPRIAAPRRPSPRLTVPAGSVGIAGEQTGIYPMSVPGGWQLIGRTPQVLFCPHQNPPVRLQPGDRVRLRRIGDEEFRRWPKDPAWQSK